MQSLKTLKSIWHNKLTDKLPLNEYEIEAEFWEIMSVLGYSYTDLLRDIRFTEEQYAYFCGILERYSSHPEIPLSYLLGQKTFFGYKYQVNKYTLIPRPETETLVELAIKRVRSYSSDKTLNILDIGTGTGCIIISLAAELQSTMTNIHYYAIDISSEAIEIAISNAHMHQVNIDFLKSDILSMSDDRHYDIVISNPPYIMPSSYSTLSAQVMSEPYTALVGHKANYDGLDYYRAIMRNIQSDYYIFESDPQQIKGIQELANIEKFKYQSLTDYNNILRYSIISR